MDLEQVAENALNELEAADAAAAGTPPATPPEGDDPNGGEGGDDNKNNTPAGGEADDVKKGQAAQEDDPDKGGEDEEQEDPNDPAKNPGAQGKQAQDLSDDELLAELEKRGKKPEDKKDDKKEEEAKPLPRPTEVPDNVWDSMNDFQRTVYDKLPYLEIRDKEGAVHRVKTNQQIPDDFEWISDAAKQQFYAVDLPAQSVQAERIGGQLQGQTQQTQQQQKAQEEANEVVRGVEALQQQGIIPKIAAQPNTPEFNNDPGVQRANEIINLRNTYLARGENISIETAGRIFKAENPDKYVTKPTKSPADAERKNASRNISGGGRGTPNDKGGAKPRVWPVGTSAADIADSYEDQLD